MPSRPAGSGTPAAWQNSPDLGPASADLLDRGHGVPQLGQPLVGVLPDKSDRPDQGLRPRPRDSGVDEGVEHQPLALTQPGHDRHGDVGEDLAGVPAGRAPRHRPAVALLGGVGDRHAPLAGLLAEACDAPGPGGCGVALPRLGFREGADDGDLVAVDGEVDGAGEPAVRQAPGEPPGHFRAFDRRWRVGPSPAAAWAAPTPAPEAGAEGGVGETMSVHEDLRVRVDYTLTR